MQKSIKDSNRIYRTALDFLVHAEEFIIFISGSFITVAMFIQIILRYVFNSPLFGLEELLLIIVPWFYFFGAAYSVHTESLIKVDILSLIVKNPSIIKLFNIVSLVSSIIATSLFSYYGFKYAAWSAGNHVVSPTFFISLNYGFASLVMGAVLMSLHFFLLLLKEIKHKI